MPTFRRIPKAFLLLLFALASLATLATACGGDDPAPTNGDQLASEDPASQPEPDEEDSTDQPETLGDQSSANDQPDDEASETDPERDEPAPDDLRESDGTSPNDEIPNLLEGPDALPPVTEGEGEGEGSEHTNPDEQPESDQPPIAISPSLLVALEQAEAIDADDDSYAWQPLPHAKGEHFTASRGWGGPSIMATLDHTPGWDPLWNTRIAMPANVEANELVLFESFGDAGNWRRLTFGRWPQRHADYYDGWDVPHSPHFAGGKLHWLRYRRADLNNSRESVAEGEGIFDWPNEYFTQYIDVASGREIARLPNLADSPRPHPDPAKPYVALRRFPGGDAKSVLDIYRLPLREGDQAKLVASWSSDEFPILSRPTWVGPNTLVVIKAKALSDDQTQYQGELVALSIDGLSEPALPDPTAPTEGESNASETPDAPLPTLSFNETILDAGSYPVETRLDTLLFNPTNGLLTCVRAAEPDDAASRAREVVLYGRFQADWAKFMQGLIERTSRRAQAQALQMLPSLREALRLSTDLTLEERVRRAEAVRKAFANKFANIHRVLAPEEAVPEEAAPDETLPGEATPEDEGESEGEGDPNHSEGEDGSNNAALEKSRQPFSPRKAVVRLPDLLALWRVENGFRLINGTQVLALGSDAQLKQPRLGAVTREGAQGSRDLGAGELALPGVLLLMGQSNADATQAPGEGFTFTLMDTARDGLFRAAPRELSSDAAARRALPDAGWINRNVASRKAIAELLKAKKLENTVMSYDYDVLVEQEGVQNAKGSMLEFYRHHRTVRMGRHERSVPSKIRSEDNLGSKWIVRTYDGSGAYLADDVRKQLAPTPGDSLAKLQAQLEARALILLLQDPESAGSTHAVSMGYSQRRNPASDQVHKTLGFVTRTSGGHEARLWFDAESEEHDLLCVYLRFPLGNQSRHVLLWLSDYGDLEDLSGNNDPLRIPYNVHGYNPDNGTLVFTAKLLNAVKRESSANPIPSGFNWSPLRDHHFDEVYSLDD